MAPDTEIMSLNLIQSTVLIVCIVYRTDSSGGNARPGTICQMVPGLLSFVFIIVTAITGESL